MEALSIRLAPTLTLNHPRNDPYLGGIKWNTYPNYVYGHGRIDALAACSQARAMAEEAAGPGPFACARITFESTCVQKGCRWCVDKSKHQEKGMCTNLHNCSRTE